jgi:hypothetical protein
LRYFFARVFRAAAVVQSRVSEAEYTEQQINKARDEFRFAPTQAARLWFVVADLVALHPMYTASLATFTAMFRHCIGVAPAAASLEGRMQGLVDYLYSYVFKVVSRGLMHTHKLVFGLVVAAAGLRESGEVTQQEWEAFVKPCTLAAAGSSSSAASRSNASRELQAPSWCQLGIWESLLALEASLPAQLQSLCSTIAQAGGGGSKTGPAATPNDTDTGQGWQQLLLHGSVDDFMGSGNASGNSRNQAEGGCLLDRMCAAVSVGQQQQAGLPAGAKAGKGSAFSLFVRLLLIKVRGRHLVQATLADCSHDRFQMASNSQCDISRLQRNKTGLMSHADSLL